MQAWAAPVVDLGSRTAQLVQENAACAAAMQRIAAAMQRVAPVPAPVPASTAAPAPASTSNPALTSTPTSTTAFAHSAPVIPAPAAIPAAAPAPTDPFARYTTPMHNPWNASSAAQQVRVDSETDEQMGGTDANASDSQAPAGQQQSQDVFVPQQSPQTHQRQAQMQTQQQDVSTQTARLQAMYG
ncbi:hypothetical protein C8R47DRAFT_1105165 [Mycena vitilis]|nr:hypothetical protein C8R47DRAFT_1105165 [Mycena vitilis]